MPLCLRILPVRRPRRALQRRLSAQILLLCLLCFLCLLCLLCLLFLLFLLFLILLWWKLLLQILRFSAQILLLLLFQISCCTRA